MKVWNWIKIGIGIIFAIIIYLFFVRGRISRSEIKKKINEVIKAAKIEEEKVKEIAKRVVERKEKAKDLADRLKKHFNIFIIMCLIISFSVVGTASSNIKDLIIPDNYSELVEAYKDMAEIAIGYQELYNEAEADNQALMEVIKNLQSLMKVQQDIIDDLLQKNRFGFFGGINYVPLNPTYSGILAGITFEF